MTNGLPLNRLQELREARSLHLVEVAAVCRVSERTLRRWEATEIAVPDSHKPTLAAFFDVSVEHLMGWDRQPASTEKAA